MVWKNVFFYSFKSILYMLSGSDYEKFSSLCRGVNSGINSELKCHLHTPNQGLFFLGMLSCISASFSKNISKII